MHRLRERLRFKLLPSSSTFQILSDLHLEVGQQYSSFEIPVSASYLILAGDIGRLIDYDQYLGFLERQAHLSFRKIFWVLGNHEFYGLSYEDGLSQANRLRQESSINGKVILLHRCRYDLPETDATLLGCTLWSSIARDSEDIVRSRVKDFHKIQDWTVAKHNSTFQEEVNWLRHEVGRLRLEPKKRLLIVTHHAPSVQNTSRPEHGSNPWNSAFATDILGRELGRHGQGVDIWSYTLHDRLQKGVYQGCEQSAGLCPAWIPINPQEGSNRQIQHPLCYLPVTDCG